MLLESLINALIVGAGLTVAYWATAAVQHYLSDRRNGRG